MASLELPDKAIDNYENVLSGNAGFIGFHTAKHLLERGDEVIGFDSVNDYHDPSLKEDCLRILAETANQVGTSYTFIRANLADQTAVDDCFAAHHCDLVIHQAAQAGVLYSIVNPHAYVESNFVAFVNVLEACRAFQIGHLNYPTNDVARVASYRMRQLLGRR